ncbi:MAG: SpoIIE family protein phosphatase [Phycisphaeraceae bacterium]|nr:SpoIIE family protein phosphatase [Phycisphaeraceae bacterium]
MNTATTQPVLEMRDAEGKVARLPIQASRLVLGRLETADVCLADPLASRAHAELFQDDDGDWRLRDLDSHNGTWVGGARIKECKIYFGDSFTIGNIAIRLLSGEHEDKDDEKDHKPWMTLTRPHGEWFTSLHEGPPPRVRSDHLSMVAQAGARLLTLDDPDQRLAALCQLMLQEPLPGRSAVVLRVAPDAEPQILCPVQMRVVGDAPPHVSHTLLEAVLQRRQALMASNTQSSQDAIELSIATEHLTMTAAACPLSEEPGGQMDVLYVTLPPGYAGTEWLALIVLAGEQHRHARITWAHRREAERMAAIERELQEARRLQMQLVPVLRTDLGLDFAICFEPCLAVGGDYVDILPRAHGRVLVTVADVCGKGIRAALTTSSLHTMVHSGVKFGFSLPQLMTNLNEYLLDMLQQGTFVTMIALEIDAANGQISSVNAGHPAAVVLDGRGSFHTLEEAQYFPLGIDKQEFIASTAQLLPGQTLALFSDGLSELPGPEGRLWGTGGVAEALSNVSDSSNAAAIAAEFAQRVEQLLTGRHAPDDRTLLLLRRP